MKAKKILRPDSKGRICLGKLTNGISSYKATINEITKEITLKPYTEIEFSEKWLFENDEVLSSLKRGLKESSENRIVYKGSFKEKINEL